MLITKTAKLNVENSAQTTFRLYPVSFRVTCTFTIVVNQELELEETYKFAMSIFGATTLNITTFSKMTLSIKSLYVTLSINYWHDNALPLC
jgi:hypothetical protein